MERCNRLRLVFTIIKPVPKPVLSRSQTIRLTIDTHTEKSWYCCYYSSRLLLCNIIEPSLHFFSFSYWTRLHFSSSSLYWSFVSVYLFLPPNGVMISVGVLYRIPCHTCILFYILWYVCKPCALAHGWVKIILINKQINQN